MTEQVQSPHMTRKEGSKDITENKGNILNFEERAGFYLGIIAFGVSLVALTVVVLKMDAIEDRLADYKDRTIVAETELRVMQDFFSDHHVRKNPLTKRYEFVRGLPNDEQTQR